MTVERYRGDIFFVCDECGDELDAYTSDFNEALEVLKMNGWEYVRGQDGEYEHYCPTCGDDDVIEILDRKHPTR